MLIALAVLHARPQTRLTVVESGERLGGNHTWSFHGTDVPSDAEAWLAPLRAHDWQGYDVFFEDFERTLRGSYHSLTGEHLHRVVSERVGQAPHGELILGHKATSVDARGATLDDGRRIESTLVVDCRGPSAAPVMLGWEGGWQKFVGLEVELEREHGLERPILMDARVPQEDGFRFVYVLPLGPKALLVEDTVFSDSSNLDVDGMRAAAERYIDGRGWVVREVVREESGVLPMPVTPVAVSRGPALAGGYAGGWFHPGTGYSTPVALRLACFLAAKEPEEVVGSELRALAEDVEYQQRYALLLNELLFLRCAPELRWDIFSRFYRLPEDTIGRFYALRTERADRMRALIGLPPKGVSVGRALGALTRYVRERHLGGAR